MNSLSQDIDDEILTASLDPLCTSEVFMLVRDILNLSAIPNSKSIYCFRGHYASKVMVYGFVVSLKNKGDSWECFIDDGTDEIQCYLKLPESANTGLNLNEIKSALKESNKAKGSLEALICDNVKRDICLGDLVVVTGQPKQNREKVNYLTCHQWSIVPKFGKDISWLKMSENRLNLYRKVYMKKFDLTSKVDQAKASIAKQRLYFFSVQKLRNLLKEMFTDQRSLLSDFYGYELFEMSKIKKLMLECKQSLAESELRLIKSGEINEVFSSAISCVLHVCTINGHLLRDNIKPLAKVMKKELVNSRYFVTLNFAPLAKAVKPFVQDQKDSNKVDYAMIKSCLCDSFSFLHSKHSLTALRVLFEHLVENE